MKSRFYNNLTEIKSSFKMNRIKLFHSHLKYLNENENYVKLESIMYKGCCKTMVLMNQTDLEKLVHHISLTYFHKPFIDEVRFNTRLRTTGGRYIPAKRLIELNPKYLLEMGQEEFHGIIKHELCHYHLHIEGKGYKHRDADFKKLLKETGSPRFCKQLPSDIVTYKYLYECVACKMAYKRKRQVDVRKFRCGKCKGKIELTSD